MGFMSSILFEPSNFAENALCLRDGKLLDLSSMKSWRTDTMPRGYRTAKGESVDHSPHIVSCPHCEETHIVGEIVIKPKSITLKDEVMVRAPRRTWSKYYQQMMDKEIVRWIPCKPYKTKTGKIMNVKAETEYCNDTRSKMMTKDPTGKWRYPHLTTTAVAKRLADVVGMRMTLSAWITAMEARIGEDEAANSNVIKSLESLMALYGDISLSLNAAKKILKGSGILIIRESRAWHGKKTGKRKTKDVAGNTTWVDLENWLGDTMKDIVAKNPEMLEKVLVFLNMMSTDRGKGATGIFYKDGIVRYYDPVWNSWIEEPAAEIRNVTYIEDMGDKEDEDDWQAKLVEDTTEPSDGNVVTEDEDNLSDEEEAEELE